MARSNIERYSSSREDPGAQPAAVQESSRGPRLPTMCRVRWLTGSHSCVPARGLGQCSRRYLATKDQSKLDAAAITSPTGAYGLSRREHTVTVFVYPDSMMCMCWRRGCNSWWYLVALVQKQLWQYQAFGFSSMIACQVNGLSGGAHGNAIQLLNSEESAVPFSSSQNHIWVWGSVSGQSIWREM